MSYRTLLAMAAMAVLCAPALVNCSSTPTPTADEEEQDLFAPRFDTSPEDAAEAYQSAIPWLHGEAKLVIAAAQEGIFDFGELLPIAFEHSELEVGQPGTQEALKADLAAALREEVGFDADLAEAYALALSSETFTAVFFGNFGEIEHLQREEVDGHTFFRVDDIPLNFLYYVVDESMYLTPVDAPRPGIAIASDAELLANLVDGEGSLASGDRNHRYDPFFAVAGTRFAAASLVGEYVEPFDDSTPYPDALGLSYGTQLEVLVEADEEALSGIEADVEAVRAEIIEEMQEALEEEDWIFEQFFATVVLHLATSVGERLQSDRVDGRLRYGFELVDVEEDSVYRSPIAPLVLTHMILGEVSWELYRGSGPIEFGPGPVEQPAYEYPE